MSLEKLGQHLPYTALRYFEQEGTSVDLDKCQWLISETLIGLEEEIFIYENTVIWTDAGLLKRALTFEEEGQKVVHAAFANFPAQRDRLVRPISSNVRKKSYGVLGKSSDSFSAEKRASSGQANDYTSGHALLVFLSDEAHIYFDDGPYLIVSMPITVQRAWTTDNGVLLQRSSSQLLQGTQRPSFFTLTSPLRELGIAVDQGNDRPFSITNTIHVLDSGLKLAVTENHEERRLDIWTYEYRNEEFPLDKRKFSRRKSSFGTSSLLDGNFDMDSADRRATLARDSFAEFEKPPEFSTDITDFVEELFFCCQHSVEVQGASALSVSVLAPSSSKRVVMMLDPAQQTLTLLFFKSSSSQQLKIESSRVIAAKDAIPIKDDLFQLVLLQDVNGSFHLGFPWNPRGMCGIDLAGNGLMKACGNRFTMFNDEGTAERVEIVVEPSSHLVLTCLKLCELILDEYIYEELFVVYLSLLQKCDGDEWMTFQVTLYLCFGAHLTKNPLEIPAEGSFEHAIDQGREFLNNETWEWMMQGLDETNYTNLRTIKLATSANVNHTFPWRDCQVPLFMAFHLLREDSKLNVYKCAWVARLSPFLAQLAFWMDWGHLTTVLIESDPEMLKTAFDADPITSKEVRYQKLPSIYEWIHRCLFTGKPAIFPHILDIVEEQRGAITVSEKKAIEEIMSRTTIVRDLFSCLVAPNTTYEDVISAMVARNFTINDFETLPVGVALPFREVIANVEANPQTTWSIDALELIGRRDLIQLLKRDKPRRGTSMDPAVARETPRDIVAICQPSNSQELSNTFDERTDIDRIAVSKLLFRDDLRLQEAVKLLQSSKVTNARLQIREGMSEHDIVSAQQNLAQNIATRTLAVSVGRGMLWLWARDPVLTEKFPIQGFNFALDVKPGNVTVAVDKQFLTEDKVAWGLFHNGAASALSIAPAVEFVDSSWIIFNKPSDLTARHAGFLLGLGLSGYLRRLASWHVSNYLTPRHAMTSIALLLGLSASYLGSMDTTITKILSVHVVALLPRGSTELNLSPAIQTAGVMGIGLLYFETQHRRMSEVLTAEITHVERMKEATATDGLRDEGYRLSAGFALGLVNLGKGADLRGLRDLRIVERLSALVIKPKDAETAFVVDQAIAGAIVAIIFMFVQTENSDIAHKVDAPSNGFEYDYIRPDILFMRTLAKHLIMWDGVESSVEWVESSLPNAIHQLGKFPQKKFLRSDDLPLYYINAGICFAMGFRFAGTHNVEARNTLVWFLDHYTRLAGLPAATQDERVAKNGLRRCQDSVALAASMIMAGCGDLEVFRRLRRLHNRATHDTPYGSHMAVHSAVGLLFMGCGQYTLGRSRLSVAALLIALYPLFPTTVADNQSHLQAFRHFWVLAAEARCLIPRELPSQRPCLVPVCVKLKSGKELERMAPCILPELDDILTIVTQSPKYWEVVLDFAHNPQHLQAFAETQTVYVYRRSPQRSTRRAFETILQTLKDNHPQEKSVIPQLLSLPVFSSFDKSELALLAPNDVEGIESLRDVRTTIVDTKLAFTSIAESSRNADELWNLRLLFTFYDILGKHKPQYLAKEFVDILRIKVKAMTEEM